MRTRIRTFDLLAIIWLFLFLPHTTTSSFAFSSHPASRITRIYSTSSLSSSSSSSYTQATNLLELLLEENKQQQQADNKKAKIESIIDKLVLETTSTSTNTYYDPDECLFGDLYCTVYAYTPSNPTAPAPLWERISLRKENIKGQQYYYCETDEDTDDGYCGSVINYSEIWGPEFHLCATGTFVPAAANDNQKTSEKQPAVGFLASIFGNDQTKTKRRQKRIRRTCPDDYVVTVNGASINVLGRTINIPIQGSSMLRVLYADPRLRIFISPEASESIAGEWESKGLIVVQVRSDAVTGKPVNLR